MSVQEPLGTPFSLSEQDGRVVVAIRGSLELVDYIEDELTSRFDGDFLLRFAESEQIAAAAHEIFLPVGVTIEQVEKALRSIPAIDL